MSYVSACALKNSTGCPNLLEPSPTGDPSRRSLYSPSGRAASIKKLFLGSQIKTISYSEFALTVKHSAIKLYNELGMDGMHEKIA